MSHISYIQLYTVIPLHVFLQLLFQHHLKLYDHLFNPKLTPNCGLLVHVLPKLCQISILIAYKTIVSRSHGWSCNRGTTVWIKALCFRWFFCRILCQSLYHRDVLNNVVLAVLYSVLPVMESDCH